MVASGKRSGRGNVPDSIYGRVYIGGEVAIAD